MLFGRGEGEGGSHTLTHTEEMTKGMKRRRRRRRRRRRERKKSRGRREFFELHFLVIFFRFFIFFVCLSRVEPCFSLFAFNILFPSASTDRDLQIRKNRKNPFLSSKFKPINPHNQEPIPPPPTHPFPPCLLPSPPPPLTRTLFCLVCLFLISFFSYFSKLIFHFFSPSLSR